ncbi:aldehyde dehydrogenase family protein [Idiomarina seosinensis]|uniref:aldehyde dehydrogenase family protein n=1 Tax=Idiomarina seosinensis TaxID=281739 RepID=UPI00384E147A
MSSYQALLSDLNQTYNTGLTRPVSWRKKQLEQLERFLQQHQQSLLSALQSDLGKHPSEARLTELQFLSNDISHTLKKLPHWQKPRRVSNPLLVFPARSQLVPEPLGTVLILGAWNYPVQLLLAPLIAAIAAGNCAVIKPSEHAPQTALMIEKHLPDYLDPAAFKILCGDAEVSSQLTKLPFDHIFYTGGSKAAKSIMTAAAEHLTPVTLELGGKSPAVVLSDCDLTVTARRIIWGKFLNAGQTCIAPDYLLVEEEIKDALVDAMKQVVVDFYGEDPQAGEDYGRIIHQQHWQRLVDMLDGQKVIFGGQYSKKDRYLAPTFVDDVAASDTLMQEEIFGPILPIIKVASATEAIEQIQSKPKPLALYVFSKNQRLLDQFTEQVSAGNVCYNDTLMFMLNQELPFGGVGNSGIGRYHGKWGFDTFSHLKPVMTRRFAFDIKLRYPPYSSLKDKVLNWLS